MSAEDKQVRDEMSRRPTPDIRVYVLNVTYVTANFSSLTVRLLFWFFRSINNVLGHWLLLVLLMLMLSVFFSSSAVSSPAMTRRLLLGRHRFGRRHLEQRRPRLDRRRRHRGRCQVKVTRRRPRCRRSHCDVGRRRRR
jgi:hypothetical protein